MKTFVRNIIKHSFYFIKLNILKRWHKSIEFESSLPHDDGFKVFDNSKSAVRKDGKSSVPKIIWTYWHDGIPSGVAHACIESWKVHMPLYQIHVVTKDTLNAFLLDFPTLNFEIPIANLSDVVRIMLLNKFGGIWLDATIVLQDSIENYVEFTNANTLELFGFYRELNSSYPDLENWLLISPGKSCFLEKWNELLVKCLSNIDPQSFFRDNELFYESYLSVMPQHRNYLFAYMSFYATIRDVDNYRIGGVNYNSNGSFIEKICDGNYDKYAEIVLLNKPFVRPSIIKINNLARKKIELFIHHKCYKKDSVLGQYL